MLPIIFPDMPPVVVIQQPALDYGYVSSIEYAVTESNSPKEMIGADVKVFLAHSFTETGRAISELEIGDTVIVDEDYTVIKIYRFKAINSKDVYSSMIDLETREILSPSQVYSKIFNNQENIVFQTCIEKNDNPYWGRLFVILETISYDQYLVNSNFT